MVLPTGPTRSRRGPGRRPRRLLERTGSDYELFQRDDEFVLSIEMPGFEPDGVDVTWADGVLDVAAEQEDDRREHTRTYHRRFRFPKAVDGDAVTAEYTNGVLEVRLPLAGRDRTAGTEIEVES